jgi:hypothetical protein
MGVAAVLVLLFLVVAGHLACGLGFGLGLCISRR